MVALKDRERGGMSLHCLTKIRNYAMTESFQNMLEDRKCEREGG